MSANKVAQDFIKAINTQKQKPSAYDTKGEVMRITEGIAWVHLAGGIDETPCELTIGASVGDIVQVRVSRGRAWLVGNSTEPPVGDKHVQNIVRKEKKNIVKDVDDEIVDIKNYVTNIVQNSTSKYDKDVEPATEEEKSMIFVAREQFPKSGHIWVDVSDLSLAYDKIYSAYLNEPTSTNNLGKVSVYSSTLYTGRPCPNLRLVARYGQGKGELSLGHVFWCEEWMDELEEQYDAVDNYGEKVGFTTEQKCKDAIDDLRPRVPSAYQNSSIMGFVQKRYYDVTTSYSYSVAWRPLEVRPTYRQIIVHNCHDLDDITTMVYFNIGHGSVLDNSELDGLEVYNYE